MNITPEFWRGRSVFLTGHTGFKGGWLALWLHQLGAIIHGYALDPPTRPSLFETASIRSLLTTDTRGDVADADDDEDDDSGFDDIDEGENDEEYT